MLLLLVLLEEDDEEGVGMTLEPGRLLLHELLEEEVDLTVDLRRELEAAETEELGRLLLLPFLVGGCEMPLVDIEIGFATPPLNIGNPLRAPRALVSFAETLLDGRGAAGWVLLLLMDDDEEEEEDDESGTSLAPSRALGALMLVVLLRLDDDEEEDLGAAPALGGEATALKLVVFLSLEEDEEVALAAGGEVATLLMPLLDADDDDEEEELGPGLASS